MAATCRSMLLVLRTRVHTYPYSQRALKAQVASRPGDNWEKSPAQNSYPICGSHDSHPFPAGSPP